MKARIYVARGSGRFVFRAALLLVSVLSLACGEGRDRESTPPPPSQSAGTDSELMPDDELLRIAPLLEETRMDLRVERTVSCAVAKGLGVEASGESKGFGSDLLSQRRRTRSALCNFLTAVSVRISGTIELIKQAGRVPESVCSFNVFIGEGDAEDHLFRVRHVAPFSNMESCEQMEDLARELAIPTQKCRLLDPAL